MAKDGKSSCTFHGRISTASLHSGIRQPTTAIYLEGKGTTVLAYVTKYYI